MRYVFLIIAGLLFIKGQCQTQGFRLTGGFILTSPEVQMLEAAEGFSQAGSRPGYKLGLTYDYFLGTEDNIGIRAGIHWVKKGYRLPFNIIQSYQEINNSSAELNLDITVLPHYRVIELPIAFLYKKSLPGNPSFFSFATGGSVDWARGSLLRVDTNFELLNPQGIHQHFTIKTQDDFGFVSSLGYSLSLSASYNFLLKNKRYGEIGFSYQLSPLAPDALHLTHSVNGEVFEATYQVERLDYLQFFISYYWAKAVR